MFLFLLNIHFKFIARLNADKNAALSLKFCKMI